MAGRWKGKHCLGLSLDVCNTPVMYEKTNRPMKGNPCRTVLHSGFHARDSFRIPGNDSRSMSVERGFLIPISLVRFRIPRAVFRILSPGFRFLGENFRGFRIQSAKLSRIPELGFPFMGRENAIYKYEQNCHNLKASFSCAYAFVAPV